MSPVLTMLILAVGPGMDRWLYAACAVLTILTITY